MQSHDLKKQPIANCQKLSATEESTLSAWILDMDKRGLPLQLSIVRHLAQLLVSARLPSTTIGENWVNCYVKRHPELRSKYTWKYDYQHARCEDSGLIKSWFMCVQETAYYMLTLNEQGGIEVIIPSALRLNTPVYRP